MNYYLRLSEVNVGPNRSESQALAFHVILISTKTTFNQIKYCILLWTVVFIKYRYLFQWLHVWKESYFNSVSLSKAFVPSIWHIHKLFKVKRSAVDHLLKVKYWNDYCLWSLNKVFTGSSNCVKLHFSPQRDSVRWMDVFRACRPSDSKGNVCLEVMSGRLECHSRRMKGTTAND